MKKIILASIVLCIFAISLLIVQSSCSKSNARPVTPLGQMGKIIYYQFSSSGDWTIWTANYDGSNAVQIPITFPANVSITKAVQEHSISVSPDGQKVFFACDSNYPGPSHTIDIYSCDISGGTAILVVPGNTFAGPMHAY